MDSLTVSTAKSVLKRLTQEEKINVLKDYSKDHYTVTMSSESHIPFHRQYYVRDYKDFISQLINDKQNYKKTNYKGAKVLPFFHQYNLLPLWNRDLYFSEEEYIDDNYFEEQIINALPIKVKYEPNKKIWITPKIVKKIAYKKGIEYIFDTYYTLHYKIIDHYHEIGIKTVVIKNLGEIVEENDFKKTSKYMASYISTHKRNYKDMLKYTYKPKLETKYKKKYKKEHKKKYKRKLKKNFKKKYSKEKRKIKKKIKKKIKRRYERHMEKINNID